MKTLKISFLMGLLICLLLINSVSAELFNKTYKGGEYETSQIYYNTDSTANLHEPIMYFTTNGDWQNYAGIYYIGVDTPSGITYTGGEDQNIPFTLSYAGVTYATGTVDIVNKNYIGGVYQGLIIAFFISDFDVEGLNRHVPINSKLTLNLGNGNKFYSQYFSSLTSVNIIQGDTSQSFHFVKSNGYHPSGSVFYVTARNSYFKLNLYSDFYDDQVNSLSINSNGDFINVVGYSDKNKTFEVFNHYNSEERTYNFVTLPIYIESTLPNGNIMDDVLEIEPEANTINVLTHVFSSADNSLIGGATVTFNATDASGDNQTKTLATGEGIFVLQHGVTYDFFAEAEGYSMQIGSTPQPSFYGDTQFAVYMSPAAAA